MKLREHIHIFMRRLITSCEDCDEALIMFLRHKQSLLAALIGLSLLVWGIITLQYYLIIAVIIAGAVGYWLGFSPAVLIALCLLLIGTVTNQPDHVTKLIIQIAGIILIAWLGREHHLAVRKRLALGNDECVQHVVTWTFINEVRNSLLAMRLLLFQKSPTIDTTTNLKLIEDELLRLEAIFSKLHDKNVG